jgi:hypothetical protein
MGPALLEDPVSFQEMISNRPLAHCLFAMAPERQALDFAHVHACIQPGKKGKSLQSFSYFLFYDH